MKKFEGFEHGMGIGGWLTNYKRFNVLPEDKRYCLTIGDIEHFESYITEKDIEYIASLGMDHIRLGFDQLVIEEEKGVLETIKEKIMKPYKREYTLVHLFRATKSAPKVHFPVV